MQSKRQNTSTPVSAGGAGNGPQQSRPGFTTSGLPRQQHSNTPYNNGRHPAVTNEGRGILEMCHQLLGEIRRGLDEQRKVKEDVRRVGLATNRLEDAIRQLGDTIKENAEQSFSVETSIYKVCR